MRNEQRGIPFEGSYNIRKKNPALCELYTWLYEQGEHQIDYMIANRNGEYISSLDNGDRYMLKKWYAGRECDIKRPGKY